MAMGPCAFMVICHGNYTTSGIMAFNCEVLLATSNTECALWILVLGVTLFTRGVFYYWIESMLHLTFNIAFII